MPNFYITWLHALRSDTCKVSVDAFNLVLNRIRNTYLVLNRIGNLLAYVAALFVTSVYRLLSLSG